MLTVPIPVITKAQPLLLSEAWDRAPGTTVGNGWVETQGDWSLVAGPNLRLTGAANSDRLLRPIDETMRNFTISFGGIATVAAGFTGLAFRFSTTAESGYFVEIDTRVGSEGARLVRYTAGAVATLDTWDGSPTLDTPVIVIADEDDMEVFVGGVSRLSATDSTHPYGVGGFMAGFPGGETVDFGTILISEAT